VLSRLIICAALSGSSSEERSGLLDLGSAGRVGALANLQQRITSFSCVKKSTLGRAFMGEKVSRWHRAWMPQGSESARPERMRTCSTRR